MSVEDRVENDLRSYGGFFNRARPGYRSNDPFTPSVAQSIYNHRSSSRLRGMDDVGLPQRLNRHRVPQQPWSQPFPQQPYSQPLPIPTQQPQGYRPLQQPYSMPQQVPQNQWSYSPQPVIPPVPTWPPYVRPHRPPSPEEPYIPEVPAYPPIILPTPIIPPNAPFSRRSRSRTRSPRRHEQVRVERERSRDRSREKSRRYRRSRSRSFSSERASYRRAHRRERRSSRWGSTDRLPSPPSRGRSPIQPPSRSRSRSPSPVASSRSPSPSIASEVSEDLRSAASERGGTPTPYPLSRPSTKSAASASLASERSRSSHRSKDEELRLDTPDSLRRASTDALPLPIPPPITVPEQSIVFNPQSAQSSPQPSSVSLSSIPASSKVTSEESSHLAAASSTSDQGAPEKQTYGLPSRHTPSSISVPRPTPRPTIIDTPIPNDIRIPFFPLGPVPPSIYMGVDADERPYPPTPAYQEPEYASTKYAPPQLQDYIFAFVTDTLPRQLYLHFLLRLPSLYFSRVDRIFRETDLTLEEIKEMALQATVEDNGKTLRHNMLSTYWYYGPEPTMLSPAYQRLRSGWEQFIDSLMREWKTLNIVSVLLLSAIMTMFQIESAAADPVTRYLAFWSLMCTLLSLLYGCLFIIRFGTMRKATKAAEWALEARRSQTILWNVWVMLSMPVVWLSWSILTFIACILSFMWRSQANQPPDFIFIASPVTEIALRIFICAVLGIGVLYGGLIIYTFRRYGTSMDDAWKRRVESFILRADMPDPVSYPTRPAPPEYPRYTSPIIIPSAPSRTASRSSTDHVPYLAASLGARGFGLDHPVIPPLNLSSTTLSRRSHSRSPKSPSIRRTRAPRSSRSRTRSRSSYTPIRSIPITRPLPQVPALLSTPSSQHPHKPTLSTIYGDDHFSMTRDSLRGAGSETQPRSQLSYESQPRPLRRSSSDNSAMERTQEILHEQSATSLKSRTTSPRQSVDERIDPPTALEPKIEESDSKSVIRSHDDGTEDTHS